MLKANASYVDNTFATQAAVDLKADKTTVYAKTEIDNSLGLKANIANPTFTGTVSGITKAMVGLDSVDNTSDASKPVSSATLSALNLKANLASPSFTGTPTIGTNPIAVKPWVSGRFGGVSSGNPNITGTASKYWNWKWNAKFYRDPSICWNL
jgi:hypothetical protein